jgi:hypothetical protein
VKHQTGNRVQEKGSDLFCSYESPAAAIPVFVRALHSQSNSYFACDLSC